MNENVIMREIIRRLAKGFTLVFFLLVVACNGRVQKDLSADALTIVKIRAGERWQLLIDGRLESAYNYQTPEYRDVFSFKQFRRGIHGVGLWSKAEVVDVACKEKCIAKVKVYVKMRPGRWGDLIETSQLVTEHWVQGTGLDEWFYLSSK